MTGEAPKDYAVDRTQQSQGKPADKSGSSLARALSEYGGVELAPETHVFPALPNNPIPKRAGINLHS